MMDDDKLTLVVTITDGNTNGVWPFASREEAQAFCEGYNLAGSDIENRVIRAMAWPLEGEDKEWWPDEIVARAREAVLTWVYNYPKISVNL
jgi:hypothetical protein